jgi:hypothetical protein
MHLFVGSMVYGATAYNNTNHDTPIVEKEYCGRSITPAA